MTVIIESGYTLPGSDEPMTHARIAHARNWVRGAVSVSNTATDYFADAPNNSMTFEKWQAYDNMTVAAPDSWTDTLGATIENGDIWPLFDDTVYQFTEDTGAGTHRTQYDFTDDAGTASQGLSVRLKSVGGRRVRVRFRDPSANSHYVDIDPTTVTVVATSGASATIVDLGAGWVLVNMTFTPAVGGAGSDYRFTVLDGASSSYTGDGTSGFLFTKPMQARGNANWQITPYDTETVDYCCIAAHNLGDWGALLKVQYDNGAGGYTDVISQQITDNSPIYCIFEPKTVGYYRVRINNANPAIGVIRFGQSMQMERAMYGGITPPILDRGTKLKSNISETGEFLGRTRIRTDTGANFAWSNITAAWVRANWEPLQKAVETDPIFIAWRPDTFSEASYAMISANPQASNSGIRDLMNISFQARGIAYD